HEAGQTVIVGHDQPAVHGVHPLDGKLHTPATVQHTGRRVDMKDPLRRNGYLPESFKLWVGEEKIEVGHNKITSNKHGIIYLASANLLILEPNLPIAKCFRGLFADMYFRNIVNGFF